MNIEQKKVCLIMPNLRWTKGDESTLWHFIPYNLCLLASMVIDICTIEILDAYIDNLSPQAFQKRIIEINPDVVGVTILMDQFSYSGHFACKMVKSLNPETITIMGGVYATVNTELAIQDNNIDYIVIGEGEYVFRDLIGYFQGKNPLPLKGICYKKNNSILNLGKADFINDLNQLPLPAYHLIDYERYSNFAERKSVDSPRFLPYARIQTSRGCPQNCVFCQVHYISGRKFRPRSAENVLNEIKWLKETYHIKSLIFDDDNLLASRKRALKLFHGMIEDNLTMAWSSIATAVFHLDEELLKIMKKSGCKYICIAIESGSKRVLKDIIKKPVDYDQAKRIVAFAKKLNIYVAANFIIGFPTESWNEIRETIEFAESLSSDYVKIFHAIPLTKTRLWNLCVEHGLLKKNFDRNKISWHVGQQESQEFSSNDLTILRAYEWDRINFTSKEKRTKTATMMNISEHELFTIRRNTLINAQNNIL